MFGRFPWRQISRIGLTLVMLIGLQPAAPALARAGFQTAGDSIIPTPVIIKADPGISDLHIMAPAQMLRPRLVAASSVVVDFLASGSAYGYSCGVFPAAAQTALTYAASIWGTLLLSSVPVHVQACWAALSPGVLGMTGAAALYRNFPHAPQSNTYYPVALVNTFYGGDLNGSEPEVVALFSNSIPYYFGTDGNPGLYQYDLASVALHEMAHGLGFSGSMNVSGGIGTWGVNSSPTIYDRFTTDGAGTALINYPNASVSLANALQGLVGGGVFFSGANTLAANSGSRAKLYSPNPWAPGSSYSHVDTIYDHTANALMTFSLANHEVVHDPGPIVVGMMKDFGWNVAAVPAPPSGLSAVYVAGPRINLSWTDKSTDETGFKVDRSTDAVNWTQVAVLAAGITTYGDTGVQSGTKYWYRVYAYNVAGGSTYSNTAYAITLGPPPAPSNLGARAGGTDRVYLYWTVTDNIGCTFIVEQSLDGVNGWNTILTTAPAATEAWATGLAKATPYFFRIRASSTTNGDFAPTSLVSATTWLQSFPIFMSIIAK